MHTHAHTQSVRCLMPSVGTNGSVIPDVAPSTLTINPNSIKYHKTCPVPVRGADSVFSDVKCGYTNAADSFKDVCM